MKFTIKKINAYLQQSNAELSETILVETLRGDFEKITKHVVKYKKDGTAFKKMHKVEYIPSAEDFREYLQVELFNLELKKQIKEYHKSDEYQLKYRAFQQEFTMWQETTIAVRSNSYVLQTETQRKKLIAIIESIKDAPTEASYNFKVFAEPKKFIKIV